MCPPPAQGQECRESDEALAKQEFRAGVPGWLRRLRAEQGHRTLPAGAGARCRVAVARLPMPPCPPPCPHGSPEVSRPRRGARPAGGPLLVPVPFPPPPLAPSWNTCAGAEQARRSPARRVGVRALRCRAGAAAWPPHGGRAPCRVSGPAGGRAHTKAAGPRRAGIRRGEGKCAKSTLCPLLLALGPPSAGRGEEGAFGGAAACGV